LTTTPLKGVPWERWCCAAEAAICDVEAAKLTALTAELQSLVKKQAKPTGRFVVPDPAVQLERLPMERSPS